jgi:hypothetical protein
MALIPKSKHFFHSTGGRGTSSAFAEIPAGEAIKLLYLHINGHFYERST